MESWLKTGGRRADEKEREGMREEAGEGGGTEPGAGGSGSLAALRPLWCSTSCCTREDLLPTPPHQDVSVWQLPCAMTGHTCIMRRLSERRKCMSAMQ